MNTLLADVATVMAAYKDDIVIYSNSWKDYPRHVGTVLNQLRDAGLTIKLARCQMGRRECAYLGHTGHGKPETVKVAVVQNFRVAKKTKDIGLFISWSGRVLETFLPDFVAVAAPSLTSQRRKPQAK